MVAREEAELSSELDEIYSEIITTKNITEQQIELLKKQSKESLINLYSRVYEEFESDKELEEGEINTLNKIQNTIRKAGKLPKVNLQFESKPKLDIEEYCREFYDKNIFHSKIVAGRDLWSIALDAIFESVAEADQSFLSVDTVLFKNEMTALRMELFAFALGCSKKFNTDKFTIPASFFTRSYLEENGRLDIWDIMGEYNQVIAISAKVNANGKQVPEAQVTSINLMRVNAGADWMKANIVNMDAMTEEEEDKLGCAACRVFNRIGADIWREDKGANVTLGLLSGVLAHRLGYDVNPKPEALIRLGSIALGFYKGAEEYLEPVDLNHISNEVKGNWLESFMLIYNQANPLIDTVAKLDSEGQPANPGSLLGAYQSLLPILQTVKNMPKPPEKELRKVKDDFERTLSMCVKAGEMAMKMLDDVDHEAKLAARMHVASIVGYVNYAAIYRKDLIKRLTKIGVF